VNQFRRIIDLPVHPAADVFDMFDEDSMTDLENDIKLNGQHMPIIIWKGMIVDGRNRYAACIRGGVAPKIKEKNFESEAECIRFIISTNVHRRHLTTEQRAMIASELAKLGRGGDHGANAGIQALAMTQTQAADAMQVSRDSVQKARAITQADPALAAEVKAGTRSLHSAHQEIKRRSAPAKPVEPPTDPDQAADSVVDAKEESASMGFTPKMEKIWAGFIALDATEQTAWGERYDAYKSRCR